MVSPLDCAAQLWQHLHPKSQARMAHFTDGEWVDACPKSNESEKDEGDGAEETEGPLERTESQAARIAVAIVRSISTHASTVRQNLDTSWASRLFCSCVSTFVIVFGYMGGLHEQIRSAV